MAAMDNSRRQWLLRAGTGFASCSLLAGAQVSGPGLRADASSPNARSLLGVEFVQNGGMFVAGFRLGLKDQHCRIVEMPLAGLLRDVMGVTAWEYQPIYSEKQVVRFRGALAGPDADCRIWADILDPGEAELLATFTGSAYAGKVAIASHPFEKGASDLCRCSSGPRCACAPLTYIDDGVRHQGRAPNPARRGGDQTAIQREDHYLRCQSHGRFSNRLRRRKGEGLLTNSNYSRTVRLDPYGVRVLQPA
jgi:beta-galactosidase